MRLLFTALLLLLLVSLNAFLGTRLELGGAPLPPMGRFLSPQEGFWRNAEPVAAKRPAELRLSGLAEAVQVAWDESGVPHLFARNDSDLYRAQGYVVAQLRLWQLDFIARAAAGRISEVVGATALEFDRGQRRKGMLLGAERSAAALAADSIMGPLLNAYADGVNQYIATLRYRDLPVEYKLLHYRPEEWTPLRSALIQQYMVDNLSGWDRDVEDTHARAILGEPLFELLFPERPPGVVPTVPTDKPWDFVPETVAPPPAYDPGAGFTVDGQRSDPTNGSNNWAVHGSRTESGSPLLANDTHLGLNFPPIWIPMQLATPEHRVFGFTIPGACGVIIGHNEHAAFGVTNAPRDTRDWYRVTWQDERRLAYRHNDAWLPVEHRVEVYKVRGDKPFTDSIRVTHLGPVMYDEHFGQAPARAQLALRWLGHDASLTQKALYLMNRVKDHAGYVEALRYFEAPAQNWVFASTEGSIAMRVQGRFPNKWKGQGRFVLDAADPAHAWQSFIPHEHNATQVDPERGFVSSANQHSVDEQYPYWFYNGHLEYYRNRSVNNSLAEQRPWTVQDMQALQHSGLDLRSREGLAALLPLLDTAALSADAAEVYRLLRSWDHVVDHQREEEALFQLWFDSTRTALWQPLQKHPLPLGEPTAYNTIRILADSSLRHTVEQALGVDARALVQSTFVATVEQRKAEGSITWQALNNARVMHLARLPAFSLENLPVNGSGTAINAQRGNHGPSQRFVVELSSPPKAWFQLPGGLSGNPGSPRYDDLLAEWHTSTYRPVHFLSTARQAADQGFAITTFKP
ncbi:MAG: penicillin acylase family protein [Flavobacteriales bacterium]|nr:penicillin acylase family protein [Flavobacteriales bacterium]